MTTDIKLTVPMFWKAMEVFEAETGCHLCYGGVYLANEICTARQQQMGVPLSTHFADVLSRVLNGATDPAIKFGGSNPRGNHVKLADGQVSSAPNPQ